jgi:hypothetical protein
MSFYYENFLLIAFLKICREILFHLSIIFSDLVEPKLGKVFSYLNILSAETKMMLVLKKRNTSDTCIDETQIDHKIMYATLLKPGRNTICEFIKESQYCMLK